MIIGIGHDLTSLERMRRLLEGSTGTRFTDRILTETEQQIASAMNGNRRIEFVSREIRRQRSGVQGIRLRTGQQACFSRYRGCS